MIKKLAGHIAFSLFLVFVFPVVFQPLHFLYHHHKDHYCDHSGEKGVYLNPHHDQCLVCTYQFTSFDLLIKLTISELVDQIIPFQPVTAKSPHIAFNGNNITLRAPPGMF